jgi:hypothetical protein
MFIPIPGPQSNRGNDKCMTLNIVLSLRIYPGVSALVEQQLYYYLVASF